MSDFITELRREVVEAHAREHARGRVRSSSRGLRLRPAPVYTAIAVAAAVLLVAVAVRYLASPPPPARPHVVGVIPVGGFPVDGVFDRGSLWIADFQGQVVRVDPRTRRVTARIPVAGAPQVITGGVWLRAVDDRYRFTTLVRIDRRHNVVADRIRSGGGLGLAAGSGVLWSIHGHGDANDGIDRIDPATHRVTRANALEGADGLALVGDSLWAISLNGTVEQIDARTGRTVGRWPALVPATAAESNENALLPDAEGAWVLGSTDGQLVRIEGGRVVRRLVVDPSVLPVLARTPDALWTATGNDVTGRYRVWRIDPAGGRVTGTVDVGTHRPAALVADGRTLCVVATDGTVVLIAP